MSTPTLPNFPINRWYKFIIGFSALIFIVAITQPIEGLPFLRSFSLVTIIFGILFWVIEDWLFRKYAAMRYRLGGTGPIADMQQSTEFNKEYNTYLVATLVIWIFILAIIYKNSWFI